MDHKNLFKEAIADAKAVREAALANAKAALEEALTPKLQSMLAAKLQEMDLNEEEQLEEVDYSSGVPGRSGGWSGDDSRHERSHDASQSDAIGEGEELEEEFDLSEILAELEEETLNEAKEEEEDDEDEEEGPKEKPEEKPEEEDDEDEEEMDIKDMSVEDLKDLIKDIVSQEVGGAEAPAEEEPAMDMDMGAEAGEEAAAGDEDEIDLEELLAELDEMGEGFDYEKDIENKKQQASDLAKRKSSSTHIKTSVRRPEIEKGTSGKNESLDEAIATINTLRNELNEVNLLNAKLLYVNKIFKAKNLTESQKLKVIASFDKATNVKEAKVVFESLQSTLTAAPAKKAIKESLGFASKAAGVAPNKTIVESNDVIARMQKLANIIK